MSKYNASSHSTYNVVYHIVFSPKYSYCLLRYHAAERLKTLLRQSASHLGIVIRTTKRMSINQSLYNYIKIYLYKSVLYGV